MAAMATRYLAATHTVENQSPLWTDEDLYHQDRPLQEVLMRFDGAWAEDELQAVGRQLGASAVRDLAYQANHYPPELRTHDIAGARIDEIRYHSAYHELMKLSSQLGLHSCHWTDPKPGAQIVRAAKYYMMTQVEQGHLCPITMTSAAIPSLRHQKDLYERYAPKILAPHYDPRNIGDGHKTSLTVGMAMTEKQGGSDVRQNSTKAFPVASPGPGQPYELVGHKYFVSAPMCDLFLVLAQTDDGLSCFLVPRWCPDGSKNPMQIQQLKQKSGNVSNASSETELRGALGYMVGQPGRGVATIIDMVAMTRVDCMLGSTGIMRRALRDVVQHCHHRSAFGAKLIDQPLMLNVLCDMALEVEAALALCMRFVACLDRADNAQQAALLRLGTAVGKYWICKRTPEFTYEAMEVRGGMGVMEDVGLARLYREAPINAIWEGSGNIQCLDVGRAIAKDPECLEVYLNEVAQAKGGNKHFDSYLLALEKSVRAAEDWQYRGRSIVGQMALAMQAAQLLQHAPSVVSDAFCGSRLAAAGWGAVYGQLAPGLANRSILQRVWDPG